MSQNKLILLEPDSFLGLIISWITGCKYSHSIVEIDGIMYDSSETRGKFGITDRKVMYDVVHGRRKNVVYTVPGDLYPWIAEMSGTRYDWKGVLGWLFKLNNHKKFYCFEASWKALLIAGIVEHTPNQISGCDLEKVMQKHVSC